MSRLGLDYAFGRISAAAHTHAGSSFACRYLSPSSAKNLTAGELRALEAGGVDVVVVWESYAQRALGGRAAGIADAHAALGQARACGIPAGRPIYFAVDFDETPAQAGAVAEYFKGIHSVLDDAGPVSFPERVPVGAYGGYWATKRLFDAKLIDYGWQTYAWSGGHVDPRAQLLQYSNGHTIAGVGCDFNHALAEDFGQAHYRTPKPPREKATGNAVLRVEWNADQEAWTLSPQSGSFQPGHGAPRRATLKIAIEENSGLGHDGGHWTHAPLAWNG